MNLKKEWLITDGESAPEGTTIKKCPYCNGEYAVPNELLDEVSDFCENCAPEVEKQVSETAGSQDAASTIKTALGQ